MNTALQILDLALHVIGDDDDVDDEDDEQEETHNVIYY